MAPNPLHNLSSFSPYLNWVWDFLIHLSFFHHQPASENTLTDPPNRQFETESVECAVCLSNIEEEDEIEVLRCKHLFHRKCLDRCLEHRHTTCPLCRDRLVGPEPRMVCELGRELILFNFCDHDNGGSGSRDGHFGHWWLR